MKYIILLIIGLIAGLGWYYYQYVYPVPTEKEVLNFELDNYDQKLLLADECKRFCVVAIAFCALLAAIFGAAEW